jgi:8-oxo-dGTP pyrophosphatase MutT (NUDIX family)
MAAPGSPAPSALEVIRAALAASPPRDDLPGGAMRASVCVVVAGPPSAPSLCLIRRARWAADPWSEHIALPGGRRSGDETAAATAVRELREEVGLVVAETALSPLPPLRIRLAGRERLLQLDAFSCALGDALPPLHAGPEIDLAFWQPVAALWDVASATFNSIDDGEILLYPALRIPEGVIFGITWRVLVLVSDRIGIPLPALEEIPQLRAR